MRLRNNEKIKKLSQDQGFLKIPLLKIALSDPNIKIFTRAMDSSWKYEKVISTSVSGFNPYTRNLYINQDSSISNWIQDGMRNDRQHNEGDFLAQEVMFLIHDYLHCWSCMVIQEEMPSLKFGWGEINKNSVEDFAFCHLLTEACATVGLDYWFLSTLNFNAFCDIGTNSEILTVSYHENDLAEFQRFNPSFVAQTPEMYEMISTFYCAGKFPGFSAQDLRRSSKLLSWLKHELTYGERQRMYTRSWLSHLSNGKVKYNQEDLKKPVSVKKPWQQKLIKTLSLRLWNLVKLGKVYHFQNNPKKTKYWEKDLSGIPDFRYTNINAIDIHKAHSIVDGPHLDQNFLYFSSQYISSFSFKTFPKNLLKILGYIREKRDIESLITFMKMSKAVPLKKSSTLEPADLFFLN